MGDYKITVAKIVSVLESNDTKFLVKKIHGYDDGTDDFFIRTVSGINLGHFFPEALIFSVASVPHNVLG